MITIFSILEKCAHVEHFVNNNRSWIIDKTYKYVPFVSMIHNCIHFIPSVLKVLYWLFISYDFLFIIIGICLIDIINIIIEKIITTIFYNRYSRALFFYLFIAFLFCFGLIQSILSFIFEYLFHTNLKVIIKLIFCLPFIIAFSSMDYVGKRFKYNGRTI